MRIKWHPERKPKLESVSASSTAQGNRAYASLPSEVLSRKSDDESSSQQVATKEADSNKRSATEGPDDQPEPKRSSQPMQGDVLVSRELICPITQELPIDPVFASDGRVYERKAITHYFKSALEERKEITSPMTREKMTQKLAPATQHKNTIERLIATGRIEKELAEKWQESQLEKQKFNQLLAKAEGGDVKAMEEVAEDYYCGDSINCVDKKVAFHWYERACKADSVVGMARMAEMTIHGEGVKKSVNKGVAYLFTAARKGSDVAAYALGTDYADGEHNLPVDLEEAKYWLEKSLSGTCVHKDMDEKEKDDARAKLQEVLGALGLHSAL
jgi:U-box domain/Sel1 repeat